MFGNVQLSKDPIPIQVLGNVLIYKNHIYVLLYNHTCVLLLVHVWDYLLQYFLQ